MELRARLAGGPRNVLVIGGGFAGSEVASAGRALDLPVTVAEAGRAPLVNALGHAIGGVAARSAEGADRADPPRDPARQPATRRRPAPISADALLRGLRHLPVHIDGVRERS